MVPRRQAHLKRNDTSQHPNADCKPSPVATRAVARPGRSKVLWYHHTTRANLQGEMPAAQRLTTGCCFITATLSPAPRDATSASQPLELQQAFIFKDLWCLEHVSGLRLFLNFHPIASQKWHAVKLPTTILLMWQQREAIACYLDGSWKLLQTGTTTFAYLTGREGKKNKKTCQVHN